MFDIGWSELVVIGIVALIAIGPKELPGVLRTVGQCMGKIRRMASEFQGQFQEAMREAEMADLKKQVDEMTDSRASDLTDFDPLGDARRRKSRAPSRRRPLGDGARRSRPPMPRAAGSRQPLPEPRSRQRRTSNVPLPEPPTPRQRRRRRSPPKRRRREAGRRQRHDATRTSRPPRRR